MRWTLIACLAAFAVAAHARTAARAPSVSAADAHITSLTDKNNRRKAMEHPAFTNAGRTAGLEIWRIENFEPVPVPARDFGKLYKGDSYIVLKTTANKRGELSWDIHYWLGSGTSQDEAGAAAILTVGLDDHLGGAPVQHREVEGHESTQFLSNFSPAIRYLDGGHASGFNHVTTNAGAEKRLFQIKGKRNVRVRQVSPTISSMNKGDCFILDVGNDVFVYVGEQAKRVERLKAVSVANQIRDQDHNGRASVLIIDESATEADNQRFFTALGSGSRDLVPEETAGGDDQTFERGEESAVTLYEISDASGQLKSTPLPKPLRQEQLKTQECYILDTVTGSIYVWVGRQSNAKEKSEAMTKAQQFLTAKKYPAWVHVARVPEGTEPAGFKQYFATWRDRGASHSRLIRSLNDEDLYGSDDERSTRRARYIGKTGAARGFMPDPADGHVVLYRVEDMQLSKVYDSSNPSEESSTWLYQGDSYVLQYEYRDKDHKRGHIVYYWLGTDSTKDEQAAAAILTAKLDNELSGAALQVRVPQGEEPRHFLKLFKGRLVTLLGGRTSGFGRQEELNKDPVRLFQVYGNESGVDMRAQQVEAKAVNLDEDDVFILETPEKCFIWQGSGSTDAERAEAVSFARQLGLGDCDIVQQGSEPALFWRSLGGEADVKQRGPGWRDRLALRVGAEPRLFEASVASNNLVTFEEFLDYKQQDLSDESVYILDVADEVYVWVGRFAPHYEKKASHVIVEQYLRRYGLGRTVFNSVVVAVKQGMEPESFKSMFEEWDPAMWQKQKSYQDLKADLLTRNEV